MLDFLFLTGLILTLSIPLIISLVLLLRIAYRYPSIYIYQLALVVFLFIIWSLLTVPIYFMEDVIDPVTIVALDHISVILASIASIFVLFIFSNPLFGSKMIYLPRIGIALFAILIGSKLIQLALPPTLTVYGIQLTGTGELIRVTNPFFMIILLIAFLLLIITLIIFEFWSRSIEKIIILEKTSFFENLFIYLLSFGLILNLGGTVITPFAGILLTASRFAISLGAFSLSLRIAKNPLITLVEGGDPHGMVEQGLVGWIVTSNGNTGPEIVEISKKFSDKYDIGLAEQSLFSTYSIATIGVTKSFDGEIIIIPFPKIDLDLMTICYSFSLEDKSLTDHRKNKQANGIFSIIFPKLFLSSLGNLDSYQKNLQDYFSKFNSLKDFVENTNFEDLTSKSVQFATIRDVI